MDQVGLVGLRPLYSITNLYFVFCMFFLPSFISSENHMLCSQSLNLRSLCYIFSIAKATCGWLLISTHSKRLVSLRKLHISSLCMSELVALAGSQRVFVESSSQSVALPKCQPAFCVLPFTLDLTRSPLVAAKSIFFLFFFCHLLSSAERPDVQLYPSH